MLRRVFILLLLLPAVLRAGGFQVNLQGQKQAGMGHTGTGLLLDQACIFFNPGALVHLDTVYGVYAGSSFIILRRQYLEPARDVYNEETEHHIGTPFALYAAYKVRSKDNMYLGLGIYTPFGSKVQWPDDWKGKFLIREIDLKTIFIQPTFSYKVNDKLGIGAGPIFATGGFLLRKALPVQDSTGQYGEGTLEAKAMGFGFNAWIYYKLNEKISLGFDYRSQVKLTVRNGDASFTVPPSLAQYFPATHFTSAIKLPQTISAGLGFAVNKKLKIAVDLNYVGWHCYDSLKIDFADTTSKLQNIHSARMYKNVFIYRVGAQY